MRKSELFAQILGVVSEVTEITPDVILSKTKVEEVVDARMYLGYFCRKCGLYSVQIAAMANVTPRQINRLISAANARIPRGMVAANVYSIETMLRQNPDVPEF